MDFKYFYLVLTLFVVSACKKIPDTQPKALYTKPPVQAIDTVYKATTCTTARGFVYLDGVFQFEVTQITSIDFAKYTVWSMKDYSSNYIDLTYKKQKRVLKTFTILPYNTNFAFSNYHELMLLLHINNGNKNYVAESGKVSYDNSLYLGICEIPFVDQSNGDKHIVTLMLN